MTFTRTRIAWTVGVLLLLAIAAAVVLLPRLLGEERVRAEAERRLTEALGVPVRIAGPISIDVGQDTRVDASDVTIGGGTAGTPPLLVLGRVRASLATGSLLAGAPELGELRLDAPRLHLHVDRDGRANWAGLGGRGDSSSAAPATSWSVAGVTIERGELRYTDARNGTDLALHDWHLQAGRIALPEPFDLQTRFAVRRAGEPLAGVKLRARITADALRQRYALDEVDIDAELARAAGALPVRLALGRLEYAAADGTAAVRGLRATGAGLALQADGTASQLAGTPVWEASVATEPFAPRDVLRAVGTAVPPMSGPNALDRAQVRGRVTVRDGTARLADLDASLDETRLTGSAAMTIAAPRRWTFDLAADRIVADRYRKPVELRDRSPVVLSMEFLRGLDVAGTLRVGQLVAAGVTLRDVAIDLGEEARREPAKGARR